MKFNYEYTTIADLAVDTQEDEKTGKLVVTDVRVNDEPLKPTERFWTSLFSRYGFNKAFFKYFDHAEVFTRISERESQDRMRVCIERADDGTNSLLAVSNPTKPVVSFDDLQQLLTDYHGEEVAYHGGIVQSTHTPRAGQSTFNILGDAMSNRFMMCTPIDGYGLPNLYLSVLRHVCTNGAVGYSKLFRTDLGLGKGEDNVTPQIIRVLDGFNNDEGYAALRQRFESSAKSWASVYEANNLYKLLIKLASSNDLSFSDKAIAPGGTIASALLKKSKESNVDVDAMHSPVLTAFHKMSGDINQIYGIANLDAMSAKRQKTLPVKCRVMDIINFASEAATHHATTAGGRKLQAYIGDLVSGEYDMEDSCNSFQDFQEFFVEGSKVNAETRKELVAISDN